MGSNYQIFTALSSESRVKWINILEAAYNEPHRHYHTLGHIKSMFEQLSAIQPESLFSACEIQILHMAIWFHDIVYDTSSTVGTNEYRSALKFGEYAQIANIVGTMVESSNLRKPALREQSST